MTRNRHDRTGVRLDRKSGPISNTTTYPDYYPALQTRPEYQRVRRSHLPHAPPRHLFPRVKSRHARTLHMPCGTSPTCMAEPLTSVFAHYWRNLPTELKIAILTHNLISSDGISSYRDYHQCDNGEPKHLQLYDRRVTLDNVLHHHLSIGDDIARLTRKIFYTQNVFQILTMGFPGRTKFELPPLPTRSLIREIRWQAGMCDAHWSVLGRVADGEFGFDDLRHVTLYIRWPVVYDICCVYGGLKAEEQSKRLKIIFKCKGRLVIEDDAKRKGWVAKMLESMGTSPEKVKDWITSLVEFAE